MKISIRLSGQLLREIVKLARQLGISRNDLVQKALEDFVSRHDDEQVRDAIDRVVIAIGAGDDPFIRAAAVEVLQRVEW